MGLTKNLSSYITGISQVAQQFSSGGTLSYTAPSGGGVYGISQSYYGSGSLSITNNSGKSYIIINYPDSAGTAGLVALYEGDTVSISGGGWARQICKIGTLPPTYKYTATYLNGWHVGSYTQSGRATKWTSTTSTTAGNVYLGYASATWHSWWSGAYVNGFSYKQSHTDSSWSNNEIGVGVASSNGQTFSCYESWSENGDDGNCECAGHWLYELTAEEDCIGFINGKQIYYGYLNGSKVIANKKA